jgi:hypothetical protein
MILDVKLFFLEAANVGSAFFMCSKKVGDRWPRIKTLVTRFGRLIKISDEAKVGKTIAQ